MTPFIHTIEVAGRTVRVMELTVADIRAWLKDMEVASGEDVLDVSLFEDFSLSDLTRLTNLQRDDIEAFSPAELRQVYEAAREVNADFFAMLARLMDLGRAALEMPAAS